MGLFDKIIKDEFSKEFDLFKEFIVHSVGNISSNKASSYIPIIHIIIFGGVDYLAQKHNKTDETFVSSKIVEIMNHLYKHTTPDIIAEEIVFLFEMSNREEGKKLMYLGAKYYESYLNNRTNGIFLLDTLIKEIERDNYPEFNCLII